MIVPGAADSLDFEALENHLRRTALQWAARAVEQRLNQDLSDGAQRTRPCDCGRPALYKGRHAKTFETACGPLTLRRAYYHCQHCGGGFFPRDRELGLEGTGLSPAVVRMTGSAAAVTSFAQASGLLAELAGVSVEAKRVERVAEALGREISAAEQDAVFPAEMPCAPTMYLGIDGTGVPMRKAAVAGRAGKQPDGSARTREVKLVTVWSAESTHPKTGRPRRDKGSASHTAAIESAAMADTDADLSAFARRVWREAERRGFPQAPRRVVMGDGARWIWNLSAELFPGAIQIVDYFHAAERLWEVAKALFPRDRPSVEAWAEARCEELKAERLDGLLATLRAHAGGCETAAKCVGYIERNRGRMRYAHFRDQGLQIGSGAVEGACKSVVGARLKQAGMRWSKDGADDVLALRCCILSGRYEQFWEWRSEAQLQVAA